VIQARLIHGGKIETEQPTVRYRNFKYLRRRGMLELHLTVIRCNLIAAILQFIGLPRTALLLS
jgi:hypothetical protein